MVRSHHSAIMKQSCVIIAKSGNDQREKYSTVKTISTNIFRHVSNYIINKHHGSKEKMFSLTKNRKVEKTKKMET